MKTFSPIWNGRRLIEAILAQPLVMRELREGLRRKSTLRLRKGLGAGSLGLTTWILLIWPASAGHDCFRLFSGFSFAACLVAGIALGGDSLSKERREGTLPFLFLSSLTSGEVVLGKFAAQTIVPAFTLFGMLPSLSVCLLIGGVAGGEVFRVMLAIPAVLFWAMALALLTSSYCSDQRAAYGTALVIMIAILAGGPGLSTFLGGRGSGVLPFVLAAFSPAELILSADATHYTSQAALFWTSLAMTLSTTYGFLLWATAHVKQSWRPDSSGIAAKVDSEQFEQSEQPTQPERLDQSRQPERTRSIYRPISAGNSIAWLVSRNRPKPALAILLSAFGIILWILSVDGTMPIFSLRRGGLYILVLYILSILQLLHLVFKFWIASAATQVFTADRRSGALEMLLGSRLSSQEIAAGVVSGLVKRFRVPAGFLLAADLLFAFRGFQRRDLLLGCGSLMLAVLFCVDFYALIWGGLIEGLLAKTPFGGLTMTLWRLSAIPGIVCGLLPAIFFGRSVLQGLMIWFVLTLATTLGTLHSIKERYLPHFRMFAFQFYGQKIPEIESPWSFMNWEEGDELGQAATVRV